MCNTIVLYVVLAVAERASDLSFPKKWSTNPANPHEYWEKCGQSQNGYNTNLVGYYFPARACTHACTCHICDMQTDMKLTTCLWIVHIAPHQSITSKKHYSLRGRG